MKRMIMAIMVFLAGAVSSFPSSAGKKETEFFSGVALLLSASALTGEQKAEKYRELQLMTGITGTRAKALLDAYRRNPEKWQLLNNAVAKLLSEWTTPSPASAGGTEQKNR